MDLVILAGGRGRRLGALTHRRQKGALTFTGRPLIAAVIDQWLPVTTIENIWVVTGYRSSDIEQILTARYAGEIAQSRITVIRGDVTTVGTLRRLMYAFPHLKDGNGLIVTDTDVLQTQRTIERFAGFVCERGSEAVIDLSPRMLQATTHPAARLRGLRVVEYLTGSEQVGITLRGRWYRHVSLRYFPRRMYPKLGEISTHTANLGTFFAEHIRDGHLVYGCVSEDPWIHLGLPRDFSLSVPV